VAGRRGAGSAWTSHCRRDRDRSVVAAQPRLRAGLDADVRAGLGRTGSCRCRLAGVSRDCDRGLGAAERTGAAR
jgi:hypothetical protein